MKVLVAGASGTLGGPLVVQLIAAGHEVIGLTRSAEGVERLRRLGAKAIMADAMNGEALLTALEGMSADAVVNELTALRKAPARHSDMTATNALRVRATAHLVEAARMMGAARFVTQSIVFGYGYRDHGDRMLTEESPFGVLHGDAFDPHVAAMNSGEQQVIRAEGIEGVALRYGLLYGADIGHVESMLRRRSLPVVRHGGKVAFIHHDDAAAATVAALTRGRAGQAYNVVDDEPATFRELITGIARSRQVPMPLILPQGLLDLVAPYGATVLGRVSLRVSNQKARADLSWTPRYASFDDGLNAAAAP